MLPAYNTVPASRRPVHDEEATEMRENLSPGIVKKEGGFVLPVVLFGLVLMSTVAIVAMTTSDDEMRSSRAMRESAAAFYVAEAGLHETYATWNSYPAIDSLAPGDSLDLGWQTLANGASYRATVYRWDGGDEPMYQVQVEGRSSGLAGGQKTLSLSPTSGTGWGYRLGACCDGPATVRGETTIDDTSVVNGYDQHPPGWEDAGVCSDELNDKPGLIMKDTTELDMRDDESTLDGDPRIVEMPEMDDSTFSWFNGLTWDSLNAMADFELGTPGTGMSLDASDVYPRYNGDGTCDTSHPYNWGSDDPNDPCFDHFPIIVTYGDFNFKGLTYGQAILLPDTATVVDTIWQGKKISSVDTTVLGGEIDFEDGVRFNGVVLGRGCVEIQRGAVFHGAVFVDGKFWSDDQTLCWSDAPIKLSHQGTLQWSQCAVDRAILNAGLTEFGVAESPGGARLLLSRSFGEMF